MNSVQEIRNLADKRLEEANLLLQNGFHEGAFYLAGYAVELMLKARICKHLDMDDFYTRPLKSGKQAFFTHDLEQLLTLSGSRKRLEMDIDPVTGTNSTLFANWQTICKWNEEKRYELSIEPDEAANFFQAITDSQNGFLT